MCVTDVVKYISKRAFKIYLEKGFAYWSLGSVWAFMMTVMNDCLSSVTFYDHPSSITRQRQTEYFEVISGNLHLPSESHGCVQITHSGATEWLDVGTFTFSSAITQ
jgi:hypothetical protein